MSQEKEDTGLIGPDGKKKHTDDYYQQVYKQLKPKKIITEEIWSETINPLAPADTLYEEDIEILQFYGNQRFARDSAGILQLRQRDRQQFLQEREKVTFNENQVYTLKIGKRARESQKLKAVEKLKKRIRVVKKSAEPSPSKHQKVDEDNSKNSL